MHFSNRHANYYTAWLYTTKEDDSFIQSRYHPDLANRGPPRTMPASQARVKRRLPALATIRQQNPQVTKTAKRASKKTWKRIPGEQIKLTNVRDHSA